MNDQHISGSGNWIGRGIRDARSQNDPQKDKYPSHVSLLASDLSNFAQPLVAK
jgi:hypothetical protein